MSLFILGMLAGAAAVFFGLWLLGDRILRRRPTPAQRQLFLAVRSALDEARRIARERGDDVTEARCAVLRQAPIETVLLSESAAAQWVQELTKVPGLGVVSPERIELDDLLRVQVRAIEHAETLALSLRYADRENRNA